MYGADCALFAPYQLLSVGAELLERVASWKHAKGYWSYWKTQWEMYRHGKTYMAQADDYNAYSNDLEQRSKRITGYAERFSDTTAREDDDFLKTSLLDDERLRALADMLYIDQHDHIPNLNQALNRYFQTVRSYKTAVWYDPRTWRRANELFDSEHNVFWQSIASIGFAMVKTASRLIRGLEVHSDVYKTLRSHRPLKQVTWFGKTHVKMDPFRGLAEITKWDDLPRQFQHLHPRRLPGILDESMDDKAWTPIPPAMKMAN
jgi:hypothetical protein